MNATVYSPFDHSDAYYCIIWGSPRYTPHIAACLIGHTSTVKYRYPLRDPICFSYGLLTFLTVPTA
jgi:hypothetical protein